MAFQTFITESKHFLRFPRNHFNPYAANAENMVSS